MGTIQKAAPCSKGSVASITLENANGMRVTLLSYGATIQSILVPDKDGRMTDVLLGCGGRCLQPALFHKGKSPG